MSTTARRLLPLAALLLALAVAPVTAQAATLAGTRVSASDLAAPLGTGPPSSVFADRQPENAPTYDGSAVGDRVATEATGEGLTPAVIGEGMASRVIPYAEENGYVYYSGVANPENYTAEELLADNRAQVEAWVAEGRPIIDIGPEPGRAFYPMATSPNYAMEQNILNGYAGYSTDTLPGEPNLEAAGGH